MMAVVALVAFMCVSCYRFAFVKQDHTVVKGHSFAGKVVVKDTGNTLGGASHVHGLFGVCVPEGWDVEGTMVMKQVVKTTTDVGDPEYNQDITRELVPNADYSELLNTDFPRKGYTWLGFSTESPFKTLISGEDESKRIDSIYVDFKILASTENTGTYYLDYVAGHIDHDKLAKVKTENRDWTTRIGTFSDDKVNNTYYSDTSIRVTNEDGTVDGPGDEEWATPAEWDLEAMHNATHSGTARAYRDLKYNKLFTRTLGWNGGDGVLTVGLPNGDVFWTFNDSFYGVVRSATRNRVSGRNSFPRNSVMVQKAHDGVPGETANDLVWLADYVNWTNSSNNRYFNCRTHLRHPGGEKTDEEIAAGDIDQGKVYWSGDGTVFNGKLQMIWTGVEAAELRNLDGAIATYSLTGNEPKGYYLNTIPDYLPHEGDYLYRERVVTNKYVGECSYGSTLWEDEDGHVYLYAVENSKTVVARTATRNLHSAWQYYIKDENGNWSWQTEYPDQAARRRSSIMGSDSHAIMLPWVFKEGDWYFMTSQAPIFSPYVYIYRSKSPYGPFDDRKLLFRLPDHIEKLGAQKYHWLYMVNLHPALSREGELVFSTNTDPDDFWMNFDAIGSADYYRPFFYRVFDWKKVYDDLADETSAPRVTTEGKTTSDIYNLQGQRVRKPGQGVYIRDGKKVVYKR